MLYTLRYQATQADGSHVYLAPSRSNPKQPHIIVINMAHEIVICDCSAAAYGLPCAHVGAALHLMEQMIRACVARNMAGQRQYEDWAATLNNAS